MSAVPKLLCALLLACGIVACGGSEGAGKTTPTTSTDKDEHPNEHVSRTPDVGDDDDDAKISIVGNKGHLEKTQIDAGMAPHLSSLTKCYTAKIGRQRYIGGELEFSFVIGADGNVAKVFFKRSTLGNWAMESCMLEVCRKMTFAKPRGRKPAHFTVPLNLEGTQATTWWDADKGAKQASGKAVKLKVCAKNTTNPSNVFVTVYVGTRGKILSTGFASPSGPISTKWAKCAAAKIVKWQLADPRGRIAKAGFRYNMQ